MLQVAIIGLGTLGIRMLEELSESGAETIIIDKDGDIINKYKNIAKSAYETDVINEKALQEILSSEVDAAIIDMGNNFEAIIMTTNCLHKIGIKRIIVEARNDEQGEILKLVGATQIIFPEQEAAKRITPMLLATNLYNFMPISEDFALVEIAVPDELDGKKITETNVRKEWNLNIVAYRKSIEDSFSFINASTFVFNKDYTILAAGKNDDIKHYIYKQGKQHTNLTNVSVFSKIFKKK